MRVYDNKGRLTVDFKLHAPKHESGEADEISLAASQITSGRFGMPRMPDGTSGQVLTAQGAGVDPAYAAPGVPSGLIAMWHGLIANIPSGWIICDGNNSTPNLLAKFVEGVATAATNPGTTGGATNKTSNSHILTVAEMPAHTHPGNYSGATAGAGGPPVGGTNTTQASAVVSQGGGGGHTHGIADIRPLYYDVAFIMKT